MAGRDSPPSPSPVGRARARASVGGKGRPVGARGAARRLRPRRRLCASRLESVPSPRRRAFLRSNLLPRPIMQATCASRPASVAPRPLAVRAARPAALPRASAPRPFARAQTRRAPMTKMQATSAFFPFVFFGSARPPGSGARIAGTEREGRSEAGGEGGGAAASGAREGNQPRAGGGGAPAIQCALLAEARARCGALWARLFRLLRFDVVVFVEFAAYDCGCYLWVSSVGVIPG